MPEKEMLLNLLEAAKKYREAENLYFNFSYIDPTGYQTARQELDNLIHNYSQIIKR